MVLRIFVLWFSFLTYYSCYSQHDKIPFLTNQDEAIVLKEGVSPVPIGLYAMVSPQTIIKDKERFPRMQDRSIYKIIQHDYIAAIALGVWANHISTRQGWNFVVLEDVMKEIDEAAKHSDRKIPVFIKWYFEFLPDWMADQNMASKSSSNYRKNYQLITTADGIIGIARSLSDKENQINKSFKKNSRKTHQLIPLNTSKAYQKFLKEGIKSIGQWLEKFDSDCSRIPMISTIAPSFRSNHMRVPNPYQLIPVLEEQGWTKEKHLQAFKEMTAEMLKYDGFKGRSWVLNMDNQIGVPYQGKVFPDTQDQIEVIDYIRSIMPDKGFNLLIKNESMTVNFQRKVIRPGRSECDIPTISSPRSENGTYRFHYFNKKKNSPYFYIAHQQLAHGYENWGALFYSLEMIKIGQDRQPGYYPWKSYMENVTKVDLENASPKKPQGTLWVEIWTQEARTPAAPCHYYDYDQLSSSSSKSYDLQQDLILLKSMIIHDIKELTD